ncbi:tRNA 2-selenouridine(34) synthase MnmH [Phenylobacterium sp.]|uniref:tRNA 2-selenouridine(34) synthase MnmH n=1 Tax=Phenylobacterium sp. TaxID=1871053 RepID=UPI003982F7A4
MIPPPPIRPADPVTLQATTDVSPAALAGYGAVIDVRSPSEFAQDHVPGAVNLPVLTDAERAQVGTIYVQESRFKARRVGAALVARNIAAHLETALAEQPGGFFPLIYCWRGGMRSNAMATVLAQVGWRTTLLTGGYMTYRRYVSARLYDAVLPHRFVLLDGQTGSAKTEILGRLAAQGLQVLDLEGLAEHRGSLFGGLGREQPSQKLFESRLLCAIDGLDPGLPVVVEAESSKIGDRMVPPALWTRFADAPRIELVADRAGRAGYLVVAYREIVADRAALDDAFTRLPVHPSRPRLENWRQLADAGAFAELAEALMALHYDPAYDQARKKRAAAAIATVAVAPGDPASQDAAAREILRVVGALDAPPVRRDP